MAGLPVNPVPSSQVAAQDPLVRGMAEAISPNAMRSFGLTTPSSAAGLGTLPASSLTPPTTPALQSNMPNLQLFQLTKPAETNLGVKDFLTPAANLGVGIMQLLAQSRANKQAKIAQRQNLALSLLGKFS